MNLSERHTLYTLGTGSYKTEENFTSLARYMRNLLARYMRTYELYKFPRR